MRAKLSVAFAAALAAAVACAASIDKAMSPRDVLKIGQQEAACGGEVQFRGVVTFVSGVDGWFTVAPQDDPRVAGVVTFPQRGVHRPHVGDLLFVRGNLRLESGMAAVDARRTDRIRHVTLPVIPGAKQADFRKGLLYNRRITMQGRVLDVKHEEVNRGPISIVTLLLDNYEARVKMPGRLNRDEVIDRRVRLTGLARNRTAPDGSFLEAELEISGVDAIEIVAEETESAIPGILVGVLCMLLVFFLGSLFVLWRRDVRVRLEMSVVAEERRRMAADLHDTIEQHLAGANLLAAGVLALDDVPPDVVEAMRTLAGLLANAKAEVRSAVMNLRSADGVSRPLAESLEEIAHSLEKTGVNARRWLRGLPNDMPEAAVQDILLIVREATTNAVKHGKARTVVFTSDPAGDGCVLRVLNDGEPFDADAALGPETGHYGLSGMRERAVRCGASISWGRNGRWTYVELRFGRGRGEKR